MMKPGERSVSEPTQAPFWGDGRAWTSLFAGCPFVAIETRSRSNRSPAHRYPLLPRGSFFALKTPRSAHSKLCNACHRCV
jgi:hypothetical protein